jgi:hypothetical protein
MRRCVRAYDITWWDRGRPFQVRRGPTRDTQATWCSAPRCFALLDWCAPASAAARRALFCCATAAVAFRRWRRPRGTQSATLRRARASMAYLCYLLRSEVNAMTRTSAARTTCSIVCGSTTASSPAAPTGRQGTGRGASSSPWRDSSRSTTPSPSSWRGRSRRCAPPPRAVSPWLRRRREIPPHDAALTALTALAPRRVRSCLHRHAGRALADVDAARHAANERALGAHGHPRDAPAARVTQGARLQPGGGLACVGR